MVHEAKLAGALCSVSSAHQDATLLCLPVKGRLLAVLLQGQRRALQAIFWDDGIQAIAWCWAGRGPDHHRAGSVFRQVWEHGMDMMTPNTGSMMNDTEWHLTVQLQEAWPMQGKFKVKEEWEYRRCPLAASCRHSIPCPHQQDHGCKHPHLTGAGSSSSTSKSKSMKAVSWVSRLGSMETCDISMPYASASMPAPNIPGCRVYAPAKRPASAKGRRGP